MPDFAESFVNPLPSVWRQFRAAHFVLQNILHHNADITLDWECDATVVPEIKNII